MKFIKRILIGLLVLALIYCAVALFAPSSYKVERSQKITASPEVIYDQVSSFAGWESWSPWIAKDSTLKNTVEGEDGTIGCIQRWEGDPELSGSGSIEITNLEENEEFGYKLTFEESMVSNGTISINGKEKGSTVTWTNSGDIPFLFRPIAMFYDMDEMMGPDLEDGLKRMNKVATKKQEELEALTYEIQTISFPKSHYYGVRYEDQKISKIDSNLYGGSYGVLAEFCAEKGTRAIGMPVSFSFSWDEKNDRCDIMPAFPVESVEETSNDSIQGYTVDARKALVIDYYGDYEKSDRAHEQMERYIKARGLEYDVIMQEFVTDPGTVDSMDEVLTKIYYFLK